MKLTRSVLAVLAGAALGLTQPVSAQATGLSTPTTMSRTVQSIASAQLPERGDGGFRSSECRPGIPDLAKPTTRYYDGQPALGPAKLPKKRPVGPLLDGYRRFGDLTEKQFIAKYRPTGTYIYPPQDGYVLYQGEPIKYSHKLTVGTRIDRFGFPGGQFLAPIGTPFAERSLPPQNLNTPEGTPLSNYHVYCVVRPFTVDAGPIAPWFGQPGLGLQYQLNKKYLPQAGASLSVDWLLHNGYLVEERPSTKPEPCEGTASELCYLLESLKR